MSKGTNTEILGQRSKFTEPSKGGRPKVNRELIIANLKSKDSLGNPRYTLTQVAKLCKCSRKTVQRVRDESIQDGSLDENYKEQEVFGVIEADFDAECERVKGYSFLGWLETRFKTKSAAVRHFNFCSKVWEKLWNRCNLEEFSDSKSQLGDQCAMKFLEEFGEDSSRMRSRLKMIRFIIRFLGRGDINDRFFTMDNTKHPRNKRSVPEIEFLDFPQKFVDAVDLCVSYYPPEQQAQVNLALWFKMSTQMRTGLRSEEREFYGLKKGTQSKSYIVMSSPEEWKIHIFAKKGEDWDIIWLPPKVCEWLFERYNQVEVGDYIFDLPVKEFRQKWRRATKKIVGRGFILHDTRKVSLTWFYTNEIPLEVSANLNVGWKDLNTATSHYLNLSGFMRGTKRFDYRNNIPDWWKIGLDDFKGFGAALPQRG